MDSIPTFGEFVSAEPQIAALRRMPNTYDASDDKPPDTKFFQLEKAAIDAKRHTILDDILKVLQSVGRNDRDLYEIREALPDLKDIRWPKDFLIAIVGYMGIGKSSLVNALLHRDNIAVTSSSGESCTSFITIYRYRPDTRDDEKISNVKTQFMNQDLRNHLLVRLIRDYKRYHFLRHETDEDDSGDEKRAEDAKEIFDLIFESENDPEGEEALESLLTLPNIDNGALLSECLKRVGELIDDAGADTDGIKWAWDVGDHHLSMKRADAVALWPFVEYMEIYTGGVLLRNGLAFADVPGFGDTNQTRTSVSYEMRRKADHEFIISGSGRVGTDSQVLRLLEESIKAHGAQNTTLVMNQIDSGVKDTDISREINYPNGEPFTTIQARFQDLAANSQQINGCTQIMINDFENHLKQIALSAFLSQHERRTATAVNKKLQNSERINIESVSADKYNAWLMPLAKPQWPPNQTRLPNLRRFALTLVSDKNYEAYRESCFNKIPATIDWIERILAKCPDEDGYAESRKIIRERTVALDEKLDGEISSLESLFPDVWQDRSTKRQQLDLMLDVIFKWRRWLPWQTFDKVLRDSGIPIDSKCKKFSGRRDINLNLHMSWKMRDPLKKRISLVNANTFNFARALTKSIIIALADVSPSIEQLTGNPNLKERAILAWEKQREVIISKLDQLPDDLNTVITKTHTLLTTETDSRTLIAKLNEKHYLAASQVLRGRGLIVRELQVMVSGLSEPDANGQNFIDRLNDAIIEAMKTALRDTFQAFKEDMINTLHGFVKIMEEFLLSVSEMTPENFRVRDQLEDLHPKLKVKVKELQDLFQKGTTEVEGEHKSEQDLALPLAKRTKTM